MISTGDTWVSAVMCLGHGTDGYSFSIFGKNDNIYICDSHSRNKYGLPAMNGISVVILLTNHNKAITFVHYLAQLLPCTQYELTQISIFNYEQYKETERKIIHDLQSKKGRSGNMKVTQRKEKKLGSICHNESTATLSDYVQTVFNRKKVASNIESVTEPIAKKKKKKIKQDMSSKTNSCANAKMTSVKTKHTTMVQTSVSHKTVKLTDTQQTCKKAGLKKCQDIKPHKISKEKETESKHANIKSTVHDYYSEIQLMCGSSAAVGVSAVATTAVTSLLCTLSSSISGWTRMDLNKIHAVVLTVESMVNIDDIPQDIQMFEMNYKFTTSCAQDLTIPTTSTNTDDVTDVLKTLYDRKWRYVLISVGKHSRSVMTLFVLGSKIFLFQPYSWIPSTHTLNTLNYCSTRKPCAMNDQCLGKFLQCVNCTIKEMIIDTRMTKQEKHNESQKKYEQKQVESTDRERQLKQKRDRQNNTETKDIIYPSIYIEKGLKIITHNYCKYCIYRYNVITKYQIV